MAIKISSEKMTPITLNDFVLYLETSGAIETLSNSVSSPSIMSATAMQLRALAANKAHILSFVVNELEKSEHFQQQNNDQPQSFVLHRTPLYTIRLMLWIPSGHQAKSIPFSYEVAHDHVFDLMTVGFFGPGYCTSLYEFDYNEPIQLANGLTRLDYKGEMNLKENDVIYYFANKDVHTQHEPKGISVSLNLMIIKPDVTVRQTVFDIEPVNEESDGVYWGKPRFNSIEKIISQRSIFQILSMYGNVRSEKTLAYLANHHESDEARALAWLALIRRNKQTLNNALASENRDYLRRVFAEINIPRE